MTNFINSPVGILITMALIVILFSVLLLHVLPKLKKQSPEEYKALTSIAGQIAQIATVVLSYTNKNPGETSLIEKIIQYISGFIVTAEQLPNWNIDYQNLTKDELNVKKHQYVKEAVLNTLKLLNVTVTDDLNSLIDTLIDMAVAINLPHSDNTTKVIAGATGECPNENTDN
jgi:competence protein ComGC